MIYYISVNRKVIQNNKKNHTTNPPYEIRTDKTDTKPTRVASMELSGKVTFVYNPASPLVSGALCWVEVET